VTLPYRQERLLRRTARALSESDPDLASMLSIFGRITAAERLPAWEQRRPRLAWVGRAALWPVAAIAFLVVFVAGGGSRAAVACSAAVQGRVRLFFWVTSRRLTMIRTLSKG
jgi:hypothetical protein